MTPPLHRLVIDASVLVKMFFKEEHSETSTHLIENASELLAPDFLWAEVVHVVWKRLRRREIGAADATDLVNMMLRVPVTTCGCFELADAAFELATRTGCAVYDGLYVALAVRENIPLVTGDQRLANALATDSHARHVRFVGALD